MFVCWGQYQGLVRREEGEINLKIARERRVSRVRGGRKMNGEEEESGLITSLELPRWVMSNSSGFRLENLF